MITHHVPILYLILSLLHLFSPFNISFPRKFPFFLSFFLSFFFLLISCFHLFQRNSTIHAYRTYLTLIIKMIVANLTAQRCADVVSKESSLSTTKRLGYTGTRIHGQNLSRKKEPFLQLANHHSDTIPVCKLHT